MMAYWSIYDKSNIKFSDTVTLKQAVTSSPKKNMP